GWADPELATLEPLPLAHRLAALQAYNLAQFGRLARQQPELRSLKSYLDRTGKLAAYLDMAAKKKFDASGADDLPEARTPDAFAAALSDRLKSEESSAWDRARAKGVSETDFREQRERERKDLARAIALATAGAPAADA